MDYYIIGGVSLKIGCIIQARANSSRLGKKVLLKVGHNSDKTVLEHIVNRVSRSKLIHKITIATTTNSEDDEIVNVSKVLGLSIFRGSEDNVLERFYFAAKRYDYDIIVRLTADNTCVSWELIDEIVMTHMKNKNDYTSNTLEHTFPVGASVEVFNIDVLQQAYMNASDKFEIEHVTPYMYKTNKDNFRLENYYAPKELAHPDMRLTLDTEQDYVLMTLIYDYLYKKEQPFKLIEVIDLLKSKPWLMEINRDIIQKEVCITLDEQLIAIKDYINYNGFDLAREVIFNNGDTEES